MPEVGKNNNAKSLETAQKKAIILHTFGVQVGFQVLGLGPHLGCRLQAERFRVWVSSPGILQLDVSFLGRRLRVYEPLSKLL